MFHPTERKEILTEKNFWVPLILAQFESTYIASDDFSVNILIMNFPASSGS